MTHPNQTLIDYFLSHKDEDIIHEINAFTRRKKAKRETIKVKQVRLLVEEYLSKRTLDNLGVLDWSPMCGDTVAKTADSSVFAADTALAEAA